MNKGEFLEEPVRNRGHGMGAGSVVRSSVCMYGYYYSRNSDLRDVDARIPLSWQNLQPIDPYFYQALEVQNRTNLVPLRGRPFLGSLFALHKFYRMRTARKKKEKEGNKKKKEKKTRSRSYNYR